jgi:hypothetical protein
MMTTGAHHRQVGEPSLPGHNRFQGKHRVLLRGFVGALKALDPALAANGRVCEIVPELAFERRREHADDRRERIRPFVGGESHHAEHDDQADHRRDGGAEPGVHQVHVVERAANPDEKRPIVLGLQSIDDGCVETHGFFVRQRAAARHERMQRLPHHPQLVQHRRALIAPLEMRADGDLVRDRELAIVEGLQAATRRSARERLHALLSSRSSSRSACRARVSLDFTVPTATPSENAISS